MGAFATQFEVALKELNYRQVEVVRRAQGISQSQVNRYVNGSGLPERQTLESLVKIFPEYIRERLVTAYLIDHIPDSAKHLVTVQPINAPAQKLSPVYGKAVHGSELAQCLTFLEERSLQNPLVADAVIATARAMRGDPITPPFDADDVDSVQPGLGLTRDIPLFGTVPAGSPSDNPQEVESYIPVPVGKYHDDVFALRVRGDSMIGRDINDGDIVVVEKREAKADEIVVALIGGETTLKTLYHQKGKWKLRSENPKHKDPVFTDQSIIQAVFVEKL